MSKQIIRTAAAQFAAARKIDRDGMLPDVKPAGTAKMMAWIGPQPATVFSY